jgi:hypothetical protein
MTTPAQENERTLARILGIGEAAAASRLARSVAIVAAEGPARLLGAELAAQLERTIHVVPAGEDVDLEVAIHAAPSGNAKTTLYVTIDADAVAISARLPPQWKPPAALHGVQEMIAACYAASAVMARLIEGIEAASATDPFVIRFAALGATRAILETRIVLDAAVLAGAGAIGNGFLRAARHLNISGQLTVCDPKVVGGGNPNRCLYFTPDDVGKPKAEQLCTHAQPDFARLTLVPAVKTFHEVVQERGRVRRVIVGTDSRQVRRAIQGDLPWEVMDASTTGTSEVIVHSHRQPNSDACLSCIYPHIPDELARARDIAAGLGIDIEVVTRGGLIDADTAKELTAKHPGLNEASLVNMAFDSLFRQLCGEQALLSPTGEQVLAPFAFVSNLAGALLALELARFDSGARFDEGTNYLFASPWAPPHPRLRLRRGRLAECEFCADQLSLAAMEAIWTDPGA